MSKTINITQLKNEAVKHFSTMPINELIELADWTPNREQPSLSLKLGNLYYGQVRIWITKDGHLYANKPNIKRGL